MASDSSVGRGWREVCEGGELGEVEEGTVNDTWARVRNFYVFDWPTHRHVVHHVTCGMPCHHVNHLIPCLDLF